MSQSITVWLMLFKVMIIIIIMKHQLYMFRFGDFSRVKTAVLCTLTWKSDSVLPYDHLSMQVP